MITSRPNTAPASGVPKIEAKPALIPIATITRWSRLGKRKSLEKRSAIAPPICTPVPSRPADPPNRCVRTVPI